MFVIKKKKKHGIMQLAIGTKQQRIKNLDPKLFLLEEKIKFLIIYSKNKLFFKIVGVGFGCSSGLIGLDQPNKWEK